MVPGDIDLTENLDFRKSRKATIPKIPWSELHDNIISEDMLNSVTMPISSTNIEFRVTGSTMRITYDDFTTDTLYIRYDNGSWYNISSTNSYTDSSIISVNNYYPKKIYLVISLRKKLQFLNCAITVINRRKKFLNYHIMMSQKIVYHIYLGMMFIRHFAISIKRK